MSATTCGYCGTAFTVDQGQPTCASCPVRGGCHYVRCPNCGYENPAAPAWVSRLRSWLASPDERAASYAELELNRDVREAQSIR